MLKLVWRAAALDDVERITAYIAARNPRAAADLQADFHACAGRIVGFPFLYRAGRVPGTREAVVHPNYLLIYQVLPDRILIYQVLPDRIEIVAVVHARQNYP